MKTNNQKLGTIGEDLAVKYLEEKGYRIIDRNFQAGHMELDIVCQTPETLVVVEVKSVRLQEFGSGESRISKRKQRSIIKATYHFLGRHPELKGENIRFDVICVNFDRFPAAINHHQGAFWESW